MSRPILLLLSPLLFAATLSAYAQIGGDKFVGGGEAHIFTPPARVSTSNIVAALPPRTVVPIEFYGRWVTPGRKLEIALRDPSSKHTGTCRIGILSPKSAPTPTATW
jgi:hypothetical protein